jgi:hypothetical protein
MAGEFTVTGFAAQRLPDGPDGGTVEDLSSMVGLTGRFISNIPAGKPIPIPGGLLYIPPRDWIIDSDGQLREVLPDGTTSTAVGITLTADDPTFELTAPLQWQFAPGRFPMPGGRTFRASRESRLASWWFNSPAPGWSGTIDALTPVPGVDQPGGTRGARGFGITGNYLGSSANELAMLGKTGAAGDWTIRTDKFTIWVITGSPTSIAGNWAELQYPSGATQFARLLLGATNSGEAMAILGEDAIADAIALAAPDLVEAAVTADIAGRDLVTANDTRLLQPIVIPGVGLVFYGTNRRMMVLISTDGTTRIYKLDPASITDSSVERAKLSADAQSGILPTGVGSMFKILPRESGYIFAFYGTNNRIVLALKLDGTLVGNFAPGDGSITAAKLEAALAARIPPAAWAPPLVPEVSGATPTRKLWALNHTTGQRTLITAANDPRDAVEDNGAILYTDNNGRWAYTGSGLIVPCYPDRSILAAFGDSLTIGYPPSEFPDPSYSYAGVLDTLISASVANLGRGFETADEIALRQGGYVLNLSVAGGTIPTSGAVTCTTTQGFCFRSGAWTQTGTLAGVAGTLTSTSPTSGDIFTFTFTRAGSGAAVPVAGTAPFISNSAVTHEAHPQIIFAGRNDAAYTPPAGVTITDTVTRVLAAYDAMVARIRTYHKEFLLLGTLTATTEGVGTAGYVQVTAINNALAAKYGNRFVDLRHYLVTQCIYDLGITPTSDDLAKIAADTLPPSIMADTVHFKAITAAKFANVIVKPKLDQLGITL